MKASRSAKKPGRQGAAGAEGLPASRSEDAGPLRTWMGEAGEESLGRLSSPRVDLFIADRDVLSRSQLKARGAAIRVNGKEAKPSRLLKPGDRIELCWREEPSSTLVGEDIPLSVLYEDGRCIVIDKAQGMVTHPGHGNRRGTLANALLGRLEKRASDPTPAETRYGSASRAGIVHRLDKDTSGLIIAAKDAEAQAFLAEQFKQRSTRKEYLALVRGVPSPLSGRISNRLGRDHRERKRFVSVAEGGRTAVTDYRVLAVWSSVTKLVAGGEAYAFVSLRPRTGRTHQLRVHMAGLGTPILGDPIYGKRDSRFPGATLMLHAYRLRIVLPRQGAGLGELQSRGTESGRPELFRAALPERMKTLLVGLAAVFGRGRVTARPRSDAGREDET